MLVRLQMQSARVDHGSFELEQHTTHRMLHWHSMCGHGCWLRYRCQCGEMAERLHTIQLQHKTKHPPQRPQHPPHAQATTPHLPMQCTRNMIICMSDYFPIFVTICWICAES